MTQRAEYARLSDRDEAGTIIPVVIHVGALCHGIQAKLTGNVPDFFKQLVLTEKAAVFRIVTKALDLQFLRAYHDMTDPVRLAESFRLFQLPLRERTGGGRHGDALVAQRVVGHLQKESRIHAAGKGDGQAALRQQVLFQLFRFLIHVVSPVPSTYS